MTTRNSLRSPPRLLSQAFVRRGVEPAITRPQIRRLPKAASMPVQTRLEVAVVLAASRRKHLVAAPDSPVDRVEEHLAPELDRLARLVPDAVSAANSACGAQRG